MPTRAKHHDFESSEQFGLRYSATGKLVKISDPEARGKEAITYTNCLDIFDLAEALDFSLTEEQAQEEAERIYENRKQFYNNHGYMKKKAIGEAYDGPVFNDDSLYRRSNGEKYTVRPDGSLESKAGKIIKEPSFEGFVHTFPRKHERTATFKEGRPRKDAAPVLTLPKQDNPLVQGECKTRTPEEASRSAAKQREQARKEAAPVLTLPKQDNPLVQGECKTRTPEEASRSAAKQREQARKEAAKTTEEEKQTVREHYGPEAVAEILPDLDDVDFVDIFREEDRRRFGDRREPFFSLITDKELAEEVVRRGIVTMAMSLEDEPTETLLKELERRHTFEPEHPTKLSPLLTEKVEKKPEFFDYVSQVLNTFDDKDLADELRRRGYTVNATKTVEI